MKRLFVLVVLVMMFFGCTSRVGVSQVSNADLKVLENNLQVAFAKSSKDVKVQVKELKNLKEVLPGFVFAEIKKYNKDNLVDTERVITNGRYIVTDIVDSKTLSSLKDELEFEFAKPKTIDVSKLTLAGGNKNSKNVIIEITDFQCPYCKKANSLFKKELKDKSDYALYIVHLPLEMHPNAQIMAQIFEAGMQMGYNFKNELFEADYIELLETKIKEMQKTGKKLTLDTLNELNDDVNSIIVNDFASKTDSSDEFKALVDSDDVKAKIEATKKLAESLNVNATPTFYINGKAISGYKEHLILKSLSSFK